MDIATTILQQLGGNKFIVMTNAKNFVSVKDGIRFSIGRNGSKANMVLITLKWDDTYTMQFWRKGSEVNPYKNAEPKMLKEYDGIYCNQLQELFTEYTGLYTKLF